MIDAAVGALSGGTGLGALVGYSVLAVLFALLLPELLRRVVGTRGYPPLFEGIPFIGGCLKFSKGPVALVEEGYRKCGEVFTVPVFHWNITFLVGPSVSPHFYKGSDEEVSQKEVYEFNVPTFGKGVVFDVDHKIRNEQFRFFAEALKSTKLKTYVQLFREEAEEFFGKWGDSGEVDLKEQLSELIVLTASRTLMGREVRENMFAQVKDLFHDLDLGMQPISVIFPYLPIAAHRQRDKSRAELAKIFADIIQDRRKRGAQEPDVLQTFIDARYKDGRPMTDEEITGMLIAVLFAGQHTSSITSAWTGLYMINNPDNGLNPALEEQKAILKQYGPELEMEVLNKMDVLHRNMTEALRLQPPLVMLLRKSHKTFSVTTSAGKSVTIPKGHVIATSPAFQHTLDTCFTNPSKYDPDRFGPGREEDKKNFTFIGFGGGRHGCMGSNFAYLQIKTIWSVLLRNFEFELVDPFPEPDYESMVVGPKPCRVRYTRRKLA